MCVGCVSVEGDGERQREGGCSLGIDVIISSVEYVSFPGDSVHGPRHSSYCFRDRSSQY